MTPHKAQIGVARAILHDNGDCIYHPDRTCANCPATKGNMPQPGLSCPNVFYPAGMNITNNTDPHYRKNKYMFMLNYLISQGEVL